MAVVEKFELAIPQTALDDLQRRLAMTRWPEKEPVDNWSQGTPLAAVQALCEHWANDYDWRRCEAMLNGLGQHRTEIFGLGIHFLHIRSAEANALPMVMTHGWPGSVIEFHKVIGPLVDPVAHGGSAADAFHLVIPSLPGYGFSDRPKTTGWDITRTAEAWRVLMQRLGYDRFVAQGGDWGAAVTNALGLLRPPECVAIHLNMPIAFPTPEDMADLTPEEEASVQRMDAFDADGTGYSRQQSTRPQTLGYGLTDSPAGQAAWIYEKFHAWSDCDGDPLNIWTRDELLDNIMLYWLTATGTSSARMYWESLSTALNAQAIDIPTGLSLFPKEIFQPSRRWAERQYSNIIHWNKLDRGGHFAAFEQPELFVNELRECFRKIR